MECKQASETLCKWDIQGKEIWQQDLPHFLHSHNNSHYKRKGGRGWFRPADWTCAVHMQSACSIFACNGCIQGAYQILVNMTSGGSRLLGGVSANLFLSGSTVTVPSWRCGLLFHDITHVFPEHGTVSEVKISVHDICRAWSHCKHMTYMTVTKLSDE